MLRPAVHGREGAEHLLVILSGAEDPTSVRLPASPWPQGSAKVLLDTALESPQELPPGPVVDRTVTVAPGSVMVLGIAP
jgi:glycogen operon protein